MTIILLRNTVFGKFAQIRDGLKEAETDFSRKGEQIAEFLHGGTSGFRHRHY